ncbi:beta-L-arabinofuranosidase domain-containing protein [Novisyntrophococcus fermenticellae]|uniref:beta-L-arabinofuranosidase domain-containing protein n=1 Tax=Novisyntrophococcus fermenticellae TaxID=2068655 RepID=UPI001E5B771E|nr:beta-L-arabinofuranosidase domain-containing protein [Novisyntrophococcus fermenticellae]
MLKSGIKKMVSIGLTTVMVLSPLTNAAPVMADTSDDKGLILHYDFQDLDGQVIDDVSGNGKTGVTQPLGSPKNIREVTIHGETKYAFEFKGGQPSQTSPYIEVPSGIFNGLEDVTLSCWVYQKPDGNTYQRVWDFGSGTQSYLYLISNGRNSGHMGLTAALTNNGWSKEIGPEKGSDLAAERWTRLDVTFDGSEKSMSLYEDGLLIGTKKTDTDLKAVKGSNQNWIGYGQFGNDLFKGMIADFKIYDYAKTQEEIVSDLAIEDGVRVEREKDLLDLGDLSYVTENLTLPVKGTLDCDISWASDNEEILAADGTVHRPEYGSGDAQVTLTATISYGEAVATKEFIVTVAEELTDEARAEQDADAIDLGNISSITKDIALPEAGFYGSSITWESADPAVISSTGAVTRPMGEDKEVVLTATITYGAASTQRTFTATVLSVYTKKRIISAEDYSGETRVGVLPSLPSQVTVTYSDQTKGSEKVVWPVDLKASQFAEEGQQVITGHLVDYDMDVKAMISVVDKEATAPEKSVTNFALSDVTLDGTDTIFGQNLQRAISTLDNMDADRYLYNFRVTFGQDTKGAKPYGGWEDPTGLLRGHATGHYMSALAIGYASTGEERFKDKLDYMIHELRGMQKLSKGNAEDFVTKASKQNPGSAYWSKDPNEWGEGFISAYSPDQFALLEQFTPYASIWAPYYTLHKILTGAIDAYKYTGNEEALEVAEGIGTWVYRRLSALEPETRKAMWDMYIAGEYGGMNEAMARLYEITGDEKYKETAEMFDNATLFDGLAGNVDTIQGRHANQHIPQILGALKEYSATGNPYYYNLAENFWEMNGSRYAYSIGGVGTGERYQKPYEQGANIHASDYRGENCETCCAYNLLKLTKDLYEYNPDNAAYMDYYERTLTNQILASQSPDLSQGIQGVTYMMPIDPGQMRTYDYNGFTCCMGTGMENHLKYQEAAYAKKEDTLYVNLYLPSTVHWKEMGVSVKQETAFPSEDTKLTVSGSGNFGMKLRVPYWATEGFTVSVNGKTVIENPEVSSYVEINREWADGDVVTIHMPYTLHLDKTPDKVDGSTVASLMYGPLVMAAQDNRAKYEKMNWYTVALESDLSKSVQIGSGESYSGTVPELYTNGLTFRPLYDGHGYRYHAYVKLEEQYVEPEPEELRIITNPTDFVGSVEETAIFNVEAEGSDLSYQWEYCNINSNIWRISSMTGNDTKEISVPITRLRDGQRYRCVITDGRGNTATSEMAALKIGAADGAPVITLQPVSYRGAIGEMATFTGKAQGEGLTLQWQYCNEGSNIWRDSSMVGNKSDMLKVPVATYRDGQKYRLVVTAGNGRIAISDVAVVTISR